MISGDCKHFAIEQAAMRPGRIQVLQFARVAAGLRPPAVKADDRAGFVVQRHDDAAVKMFVAAVAPQAKLRQPRPQRVALLPVVLRQPQAQRPVGKADLKTVNEFVAVQSPAGQICARRRRLLQPFVIVARHLAEQRRVVRSPDPTDTANAARSFVSATAAPRMRRCRPGSATRRRAGTKRRRGAGRTGWRCPPCRTPCSETAPCPA